MNLWASVSRYAGELWDGLQRIVSGLNVTDIIDILLVTVVIYGLIILLRRSNAFSVLKGILILLAVAWLSSLLELTVLSYLLQNVTQVGLFALVVVFQPELRRVLETMGATSINVLKRDNTALENAIPQITDACADMSRARVGALIALQRNVMLTDFAKTGTGVDASVTSELLKNIFYPKAPLHDGAVILVQGRITAAGCVLPLTNNPRLSKDLGTRHKAAIGLSENSDAVVVVVSEESGVISVASAGMLKRHLAPETLEKLLRNELLQDDTQSSTRLQRLLGRFKVKQDGQ